MKSTTGKLRLGVINVLNVLPVYYGILTKRIPVSCELVKGRVTELNQKLNRGELDLSVISSFEYAQNPDLYYILPNLSVSADGPVRSIYLFTKKPIEELRREKIKLTEYSLTSVHLIQYILEDLDVEYIQGRDGECTGELLIADEAIRRFYEKRDNHVYDLASLWKQRTGLPFAFALWVVRRDSYEQNPEEIQKVYRALLESKKSATLFYETMARENYAGVFPDHISCAEYLKNLHYDFSERYQEGFHLFQKKMLQLEKLTKKAPLTFLPKR